MNKLSIIIPTLNEVRHIEPLLNFLVAYFKQGHVKEIIVVDGGSTDGTLELVAKNTKVQLIRSEPGRARQLNSGALQASGDILYFLHADCWPPEDFDKHIIKAIEEGQCAGCFRLQFDSKHWWLRLAGWFTQFNWRMCRGGDQSLFIKKTLFNDIGGYNETYPIYEDNVLVAALYDRNSHMVINHPIKTSARLYEKVGIWTLQYHFWCIHFMHFTGATPDKLYAYYKKHVASKA
jgi:rSAM/selenodomain-associated transferase 2